VGALWPANRPLSWEAEDRCGRGSGSVDASDGKAPEAMKRLMKTWLLAAAGTLAIHAAIVGYLAMHAEDPVPAGSDAVGGGKEGGSTETAANGKSDGSSVAGFLEDPVGMLSRKLDALSDTSPEDLEEKLASQVDRFTQFVSADSADEIQKVIARAGGVDPDSAKYVPREDAVGPFDATDCLIHDIQRREGESGYDVVMVDHKGTTVTTQMAVLSPELQRVHRVYNLVRERPALRSLVRTAWQIADRIQE